MTLFDPHNKKGLLARLISDSRGDFSFDRKGVRNRLLSDIEELQLDKAERHVRRQTERSFVRRHAWGLSLAVVLLAASATGTAAMRGNISQPGDPLHAIDELQEQIMLNLPMPVTSKAEIQADIVDERGQELEHVLETAAQAEVKDRALDDSVRSLDEAVEKIRNQREEFAGQGKTDRVDRMDEVLKRLEGLAQKQEQRMLQLKDREIDEDARKSYERRLDSIRQSRQKAGGDYRRDDGDDNRN